MGPATESRFVTGDGTTLHVETRGPSEAPVVLVLVHGWTQDRRTWDRVIEHLPREVRYLRYDLRGHGDSAPAPPGTATIEQLADDLAALITEQVRTGRLVLAGHSMGGMTIMALAERHPRLVADRVAGVAFVATSCGNMNHITLGLPGVLGSGAACVERRLGSALAAYRGGTLPLRPAVARAGARWLVFGRTPRRADVAAVDDQLLRAHPRSGGGFRDAISRHDRRTALATLHTTPAVVLAGAADRLCPLPHAQAIARELPGGRLIVFPGAGHMLGQERPRDVAGHLRRLLRTAASDRSAPVSVS
jgi:pimeloyl-ACP methyl ester carboxylesterase